MIKKKHRAKLSRFLPNIYMDEISNLFTIMHSRVAHRALDFFLSFLISSLTVITVTVSQVSCSNTHTILSINSGKIRSSKYYPSYSRHVTCTWLLTSSARVRVNLVELYCSSYSQYLLRVYDGSSKGAPSLRKYAGSYSRHSLPSPTTSSGHTMFLYWKSNYYYYRGFDLRYYGEPMARLSYPVCAVGAAPPLTFVQPVGMFVFFMELCPLIFIVFFSFFFFFLLLLLLLLLLLPLPLPSSPGTSTQYYYHCYHSHLQLPLPSTNTTTIFHSANATTCHYHYHHQYHYHYQYEYYHCTTTSITTTTQYHHSCPWYSSIFFNESSLHPASYLSHS